MKKLKNTLIPRNLAVLNPIMKKGCAHRSQLRKPRGSVKIELRQSRYED